MNRYNDDPDDVLDRAASEIREEPIDSGTVESAAARIWGRLSADLAKDAHEPAMDGPGSPAGGARPRAIVEMPGGSIQGCAGFQRMIPDYLSANASQSRALLLEDHVRDCIACRRALDAARSGSGPYPFEAMGPRPRAARRASAATWTLAAAASIGLVLLGLAVWQRFRPALSMGQAQVRSLHGGLYRVSSGGNDFLQEGARVGRTEQIRTAKASGAVIQLADGSLIEMDERAAVSVSESGPDTTIHLPRGNIIVQAAKRSSGHLFVSSGDALVSVTGTIFSVSHGTKGLRVSVIEGEVHVEHGGKEDVLRPGDQISTHESLERVPVASDIAWSRDVNRYLALLSEMAKVRRELDQTVLAPGLRTSTRLLDMIPAGTVVYAAFPNVSRTLNEVHRRIEEHLQQSEVLREWWEESGGAREMQPEMQRVLEKIGLFGNLLGEEIVLSVQADEHGEIGGFVLMSELTRPGEFESMMRDEIRKAGGPLHGEPALRILPENLDEAPSTERNGAPVRKTSSGHAPPEIVLWVHGDRLVAATSVPLVRQVAAVMERPGANPFTASSFHTRIAEAYHDGAGWLFCVDVQKILGAAARASRTHTVSAESGRAAESNEGRTPSAAAGEGARAADSEWGAASHGSGPFGAGALEKTGLLDAEHFILDVKESPGRTNTHAVLTFSKSRSGIASWLAEPAPMGALSFMSPDTTLLAAFVVKEPSRLVEDLFGILREAPGFDQGLQEFESESGIDIRQDLAAPLGGEFAFGLDGPILPVPAWKLVLEVYDPQRFQQTLERVVSRVVVESKKSGRAGPELHQVDAGGRTFYELRCEGAPTEIHYVYVDGYLLAAPRRSLLERAIQCHESGFVLGASQAFRDLMPGDGQANFSALVYQNFGPVLEPLAQNVAGSKSLTPEQQQAVAALRTQARAQLGCAYAEQDRIVFASKGNGTLTSSLGGLFGLSGEEQGMAHLFGQAMKRGGPPAEADSP